MTRLTNSRGFIGARVGGSGPSAWRAGCAGGPSGCSRGMPAQAQLCPPAHAQLANPIQPRPPAVEISSAAIVVTCSKLGLPVSTTHCLVGAVSGIGARGPSCAGGCGLWACPAWEAGPSTHQCAAPWPAAVRRLRGAPTLLHPPPRPSCRPAGGAQGLQLAAAAALLRRMGGHASGGGRDCRWVWPTSARGRGARCRRSPPPAAWPARPACPTAAGRLAPATRPLRAAAFTAQGIYSPNNNTAGRRYQVDQ